MVVPVGGRRGRGGDPGLHEALSLRAAASSISTPRAPTCQMWTSCGPTTRGSLTSTAPVSSTGDRPAHPAHTQLGALG